VIGKSSLEFDFRDLDLPSDIVEINVLALMSSVMMGEVKVRTR
jgi:hypothetical protein